MGQERLPAHCHSVNPSSSFRPQPSVHFLWDTVPTPCLVRSLVSAMASVSLHPTSLQCNFMCAPGYMTCVCLPH